MEKNNIITTSTEIDIIEERINTHILNSEVFDIIEVTYAYKSLDD